MDSAAVITDYRDQEKHTTVILPDQVLRSVG